MKNDIRNREDIKLIVDAFYEKVKKDDEIAFFFSEIIAVEWEKHLPIMYDFWENVLFHVGIYQGNPTKKPF